MLMLSPIVPHTILNLGRGLCQTHLGFLTWKILLLGRLARFSINIPTTVIPPKLS